MLNDVFRSIDIIYWVVAGVAVAAFLWFRRRQKFERTGGTNSAWATRTLMTKEEAQSILPQLSMAAEGLYVFPRLTASTLLKPHRKAGKSADLADRDLDQVTFDYAVFTPECDLVCVVLVDHGTKPTPSDRAREAMLRSASVPVVRLRKARLPETAVLRGHLRLALDQRKLVLSPATASPVSTPLPARLATA